MNARLKIALIGLGRMGQIYAQTLAAQPAKVQLYAIADPDKKARQRIANMYAVPHVAADAADVLELAEVDAVIIATPTHTHADLLLAAAEAGKAVFCEKPLALTLNETHAALDAVAQAGILLQVGLMRRFDPAYQSARQQIEAGAIGQPVTFKSIGRDPFCPNVEFAHPARSGGLIIDMGIHDFDLARWLMGSEAERVTAEGTLQVCHELRAVDDIDNAVINLRFVSGTLGNVELSRNAFYGYDIRTEVLGSDGALLIGTHHHTPVLRLTRDGAQYDTVPYLTERFGTAYHAQIAHFVDCVRNDRQPAVSGLDALAAFEIGLAATQACQTGQPVRLDDIRRR